MDVVAIGETMVLFTPASKGFMRHAETFTKKIGGAETNTLIGLARLGRKTGWISRVGNDEFGTTIQNLVRGEGIDISQVKRDDNAPTAVFFKEIINESNLRIFYYRKGSAASRLTPADIDESYIAQSRYLHLTGITPALSPSCRESVFHAIRLAKKNGVTVVFDPNIRRKLWDDETAKTTLLELSKQADIVLPGIGEGEFLFDTNDEEEIGKHFLEMGARQVVVKLGEKGAYYTTEEQGSGRVSGVKIDRVVDPVGAGDAFAAGLLFGLLEGKEFRHAVKIGCAAGALVCTVEGDMEGLPDYSLLDRFMKGSDDDIVR